MTEIIEARFPEHLETVRALFREYADSLNIDLSFQNFESEVADLPGKFAAPLGRILLAQSNGQTIGCVAMRPIDDTICEMKRLYIGPSGRGQKIGRQLGAMICQVAKEAGYARIRLDTLPSMHAALHLYASLGFKPISAYVFNPIEGAIFLECDLTGMNSPTVSEESRLSERDMQLLLQSITLSEESRNKGRHPFAAIVADEHGHIVVTAGNNSMPPEGDPTQHAELVAAAQAAKLLTPEQLAKCTLYTSAEPCCMCSGAIYWCNIGRVVYALSEQRLLTLTGDHPENPTFSLPCREVFLRGQRHVEVIGPLIEDEAARSHAGFW